MEKFTIEEIKYLQSKNYFVEFLDDLSGWWLTKDLDTEYFGKCIISIDEFQSKLWINVDRENSVDHTDDSTIEFIKTPYAREDLNNIENILEKNYTN